MSTPNIICRRRSRTRSCGDRSRLLLLSMVATTVFVGCPTPSGDDGGNPAGDDAGQTSVDGGQANDAGTPPNSDAGPTLDAGAPRVDAGSVDAGSVDAGVAGTDAGPTVIAVPDPPLSPFPAATQTALQNLVDSAEAANNGRGAVGLRVESRSNDLLFEGVAGETFRQSGTAFEPSMTMEIASVSKAFTAVATLMLIDDGVLDLDALVSTILPPAVMEDLLVVDGVNRGGDITVRHLLSHRSGLPHYWDDPPFESGTDNAFILAFSNDPTKFWTPDDILAHVKAQDPAGVPGGQFHYADGGYLLLGMIIEAVSGESLEQFYRSRVWEPLDLDSAHLSYREDPRVGFGASHLYWGQDDMTGVQAMSADWAGGGLVMNARDMARFMFGVVGGYLLTPTSLNNLRAWSATTDAGIDYGLGMYRVDYTQFAGYEGIGEVYGHDGYGGAFMYYWPQEDIVFTGTLNHAENDCFEALIEPALFELLP